jgi:DNA ligase-associated metallophosphoesterase
MNEHRFTLAGAALWALPSGALWWPDEALLCVSDLHLGKAGRIARRVGLMLPPWEAEATLDRLATEIDRTAAGTVLCLGDSFDDLAAADSLPEAAANRLTALMAGRRWVWILGNHDPGPVDLGGSHLAEARIGPLTFRHEALRQPEADMAGEVSGHYHPKLSLPGAGPARPCFLYDSRRLILPAFGTYTGGMSARDPNVATLFRPPARAILTGRRCLLAPLPL